MENIYSKEYITIGIPIITKELFRNILIPLNNFRFKPSGGLFASEHINNFYTISPWFRYLKNTDGFSKQKNMTNSVIFSLKETAKILCIENEKQLLELAQKYPSYHNNLIHYNKIDKNNTIFDFEKISEQYDGIYLKVHNFYNAFGTIVFDTWQVDTLLLFNLNCIKNYRTAPITFDKIQNYIIPNIKEENISLPKKIEEESYEHKKILESAETIFLELTNNYQEFSDYEEYLITVTKNTGKLIKMIKQEHQKELNEILNYLYNQNIIVTQKHLIENIALNNLSTYLKKDTTRIKTLKPSKTQYPRTYSIY